MKSLHFLWVFYYLEGVRFPHLSGARLSSPKLLLPHLLNFLFILFNKISENGFYCSYSERTQPRWDLRVKWSEVAKFINQCILCCPSIRRYFSFKAFIQFFYFKLATGLLRYKKWLFVILGIKKLSRFGKQINRANLND